MRSIAGSIAHGERVPDATLEQRAHETRVEDDVAGRVHGCGSWRDPRTHAQLADSLGAPLSTALRDDFEWYQCRGAFFHNDAHYDARVFGVWCIAGTSAEIVFPRVKVRLPANVGSIVVFDPFEVHGVLAPGRSTYAADDYEKTEASIFLGFELDVTSEVAQLFGISSGVDGSVISSRTRISATSGELSGF